MITGNLRFPVPLMRALVREPLVHFVVLGGLLFGLDAARRDGDGAEEREDAGAGARAVDHRIVVTRAVRDELAARLAQVNGRAPTEAELERALEAQVDEEVLYREGMARGLGEDDPAIRARVAAQMRFVLSAEAEGEDVPEDAVRAFFDAHRERWAAGTRVSFTHVFVQVDGGSAETAERAEAAAAAETAAGAAGAAETAETAGAGETAETAEAAAAAEARADELLALLRGGASPAGLGDRFSGGRRYRARDVADLAEAFGDAFADAVAAQSPGTWEKARSRFGIHLVRVDAIVPAHAADFDEVRDDVRAALREERASEAVARDVARLRALYSVVREP